ncbi:hypothetical protein CPB97_005570, partial [Podila verticillata]
EGANPNGTPSKDTGATPKPDLEPKEHDNTVTVSEKIADDKNPLQSETEIYVDGMDVSE